MQQVKIEYEGANYEIEASTIDGLDDEQIIDLLSPGFPGMAGAKVVWENNFHLKIIKRAGTKGCQDLIEIIKACPKDELAQKLQLFSRMDESGITLAQWERTYQNWDFASLQQLVAKRTQKIESLIKRIYNQPSKVRPWI
ncbi:MAG: hypothetical protein AAFQ80_07940 [Cyanobacteria bacterium J06621_8]